MHGACPKCSRRGFNWNVLWELSTIFWELAPETDDYWKWNVRRTGLGFTVEELYEIMLGVFMGSDRPNRKWDIRGSYSAYAPNKTP